jgi:hypothetical protein
VKQGELSFQQIYNQLFSGSKLVLYFPDAPSAETFRTRLHHHKAKQEKTLEGLGLRTEEDRTVLSFKTKKDDKEGSEAVVAYIAFALPSPLKKYPVVILEEKDLTSGAEVPSTVG